MPRKALEVPAGKTLDSDVKQLVMHFFGESAAKKLEKDGGRITISIRAPHRPRQNRPDVDIDTLVNQLTSNCKDSQSLWELLRPLTAKQLHRVSECLEIPVKSGATVTELREGIVRGIQAAGYWKRISGTGEPDGVT